MAVIHRLVRALLVLVIVGACAALLWALTRRSPEDLPWTKLDLGRPIGLFTGRKLAALAEDPAACRLLLDRAGVAYAALPSRGDGECRAADPLRFGPGGARQVDLRPARPVLACPVAAALAVWEWQIVQPAARRHFGMRVAAIDHLGTYSCRRLYGREQGAFSEHARANAIDVAGFRLADGRRVRVLQDWDGRDPAAQAFLREVRDGACRLFGTVLSPEYNAAHRDHLHLDQAARGSGWRACR
jgi:hypothetical protein